jgi:alginate O-acetyltransferase complex protein AlgI
MGGNKHHQLINLAVVWALTGFWHGASWNFILWGCFWGFFIILEKFIYGDFLKKLPSLISHVYLLFLALIGWALFYFTDLNKLWLYLKAMFGSGVALTDELAKSELSGNIFVLILAVIFALPIVPALKKTFSEGNRKSVGIALSTACAAFILIISSVMLVGMTNNPFLYFRF